MLTCQSAYVVQADRKNWPTVHTVGRIIWQVGIDDQRHDLTQTLTQCLKITEKVSFNIASEASYVYIYMSGQKWIKNAKN